MEMMNTEKVVDFIAVGVGPFNLGLACLTTPIDNLNGLFFDKREKFNWHPGMLLEDTTLQIPFIADLVTMADPTSEFSFLNYIKKQGKMYSFYIKEDFLLLRNEYNQYCQWAISKLPNVHFKSEVIAAHFSESEKCYHVQVSHQGVIKTVKTKKLVLGTGTQPYVPKACQHLKGKVSHSSSYLQNKTDLQTKKSITVVGSGQSAAEIFYDLLQEIDDKNYQLNWITRSSRFFPLEYSKLTLEMTSPEYVDYFYNLPESKREHLINNQKHLYKGINHDLIANIFDLMYTKQVTNKDLKINLRTNSTLKTATYDEALGSFYLEIHQHEEDKYYAHKTEALVLATGYSYQQPSFIEGIKNRIQWDAKGRYAVQRNYSIDTYANSIFVQNAELHTHGFVTPDLGMAAYRNSYIIKEITGEDHYAIEQKIAFQQFEVSKEEEIKIGVETL